MNDENNIQIFTSPEFGEVRTIIIDDEFWFVGKEVAKILGYKNTKDAISVHVDTEDKKIIQRSCFPTLKIPNRGLTVINESGLYSLILSSKLESAKRFKRWITKDVIPSIRKHGAYMTPETLQKALSDPDNLIQLLQTLKEEQDNNKKLKQVNAALTDQAHEWENKSVLNALIRAYAVKKHNSIFGVAWNEFYKNLQYQAHINLKIRRGHSKDNKKLIDYIHDDEFNTAIKIAVAMCEKAGIDTYKTINEINMENVGE